MKALKAGQLRIGSASREWIYDRHKRPGDYCDDAISNWTTQAEISCQIRAPGNERLAAYMRDSRLQKRVSSGVALLRHHDAQGISPASIPQWSVKTRSSSGNTDTWILTFESDKRSAVAAGQRKEWKAATGFVQLPLGYH
ncbi:MAG TPA: hypothetical protein V6C97_24170 [Oculatellaceae cyanobacterium]